MRRYDQPHVRRAVATSGRPDSPGRQMSIDVSIDSELQLIFCVPLLVTRVPDSDGLNAGLSRVVLARRATSSTGAARDGSDNSWRSDASLLSWPGPEIATINAMVDKAIRRINHLPAQDKPETVQFRCRAAAAAVVSRSGQYDAVHSNHKSHWSALYWASTGGTPGSGPVRGGALELRDPRPAAVFGRPPGHSYGFGVPIHIAPEAGMLVMFPAWVEHWMHPFSGVGERIVIAVNIETLEYRDSTSAIAVSNTDQPLHAAG